MIDVAIIGGGLAGLAAACDVADAGRRVTVFEKRPWLGGKTYSFTDRETEEAIDNGQHIAMRCTTAYVEFLERLGTAHLIDWQPALRVPVIDASGRRSDLAASSLPAPLYLAASFAKYKHLSAIDKLRVGRAMHAITRVDRAERSALGDRSFGTWLREHGQTGRIIRDVWDLIVVPALNCSCDDASAAQAIFVFQEGFLKSATAAAIGVPRVGLSQLHVEPAIAYIRGRGGDVRSSSAIERIEIDGDRVEAVVLADGERIVADAYIAALPPRQLLDALPPAIAATAPFHDLARMRTAPIINVHLWFSGPVADFAFAAFTGSGVQWVFRPVAADATADEHVVVSLSAAERYMALDKTQLVDLLLPQLRRALPLAATRRLLRSTVIKEPEATFVPAPGVRRPGARTPIGNLFLAGAYTDTGWPATMESAVRSGHAAVSAVLQATASFAANGVLAPV